MSVYYYLSVYPQEALIASMLAPEEFGHYMAMGRKNGSYERIMFIDLDAPFGTHFDWKYARERCVPHPDGTPKHSVWLSVYRTLEHVKLDKLKSMYLTTADGRTLELPRANYEPPETNRNFYVYQELAPVRPLVVSALDPRSFSQFITDPKNKISVPQLVFADLKVVDIENYEQTGNLGAAYDRNLEHLRDCIRDVTTQPEKPNKNVERSVGSFSYQIIDRGIYVAKGPELVEYRMPPMEELRRDYYLWSRSAMIV